MNIPITGFTNDIYKYIDHCQRGINMKYEINEQTGMTKIIGFSVSTEFDALLKEVSEKTGTWNKSLMIRHMCMSYIQNEHPELL
jgi:hypothetical protein